MTVSKALARTAIALGLGLMALVQLLPFYLAITTAAKPKTDLSSPWIFPAEIYWQNVQTAIEQGGILTAIGNSAIVTAASTVIICFLGALTAYPLARRTTLGNRVIFAGIVGLIMIPPLSILVPLYTLMNTIDGVNTYWGIILVMTATQLPLSVFLYASFMRGLPFAIEEAAIVDGANSFQVLFRVVFPMLRPVTATVAILAGVNVWNEFALSLYFLRDPAVRTIAPAISAFFGTQSSNVGAAVAGSLISVVPVLIAYLVLQKHFIKGIVAGAVK